MNGMDEITAVFFDLDGTLIDISRREVYAVQDAASYFGVEVSRVKVKRLLEEFSIGSHELRLDLFSSVFGALGLTSTDQTLQYLISSFLKRYNLSVLPTGTKETLKSLSKKYELLCVTSRETLAEVELELRFLGISRLLSEVVTREVAANHFGLDFIPFTPFKEQRRKLYECALVMVDCHPSEVLVVGDMACELIPAKEMGMMTVGLLSDREKEEDLRETSDYLISSITQLRSIFDKQDELLSST